MCNLIDALWEHWNEPCGQTSYDTLLKILEEDRLNSILILIYFRKKQPTWILQDIVKTALTPNFDQFKKTQRLISTKPSKLCILTSFAPYSIPKLQIYIYKVNKWIEAICAPNSPKCSFYGYWLGDTRGHGALFC